MTTITALTAQNTQEVRDIHYVPEEFVEKSLAAVFEDMPVDVVKMGMLGSAKTIDIVAKTMEEWKVTKLVLDPVCSGFLFSVSTVACNNQVLCRHTHAG